MNASPVGSSLPPRQPVPPGDGWDLQKTTHPHPSPGPLDFYSLPSRDHLAVFLSLEFSPVLPAGGSLMPPQAGRPQREILSRRHSLLFVGLGSRPWLASRLRPLAALLGRKVRGRRHWGESPQAKQAPTADSLRGGRLLHTQARAAGGKASGSRGGSRGRRQESPLPSQPAALPPDPCTTPCLGALWVRGGQRRASR